MKELNSAGSDTELERRKKKKKDRKKQKHSRTTVGSYWLRQELGSPVV